ncbi:hypothetical protein GV828_01420 [Flavobacterium sp. NST-5]|uniref:DUF6705 domain-containing protein n=1 Tax=Flavobacterium ichthyis TaxID=2698827 RepID=A0ABW9ZAM3_9FLAO|nr:DUF6705 family protein [Flavobacterium ichthyis]NBL63853.1 hypothetical protein [Flavobacterium ichthyis]
MKSLPILLIIVFSYYNITAQTIVNMAETRQTKHLENGTYYIKDVNNYMLPYLGTWKYIDGNKEFRITLTKVAKLHKINNDYSINYYIDALQVKYQKFENGQIVYDAPIISYPSGIIKEFGKLNMSFKDYERNGEIFPVDLLLIPLNNMGTPQYKLKFKLDKFEQRNTYYEQHPNEPYFSVPNNIIMTKF